MAKPIIPRKIRNRVPVPHAVVSSWLKADAVFCARPPCQIAYSENPATTMYTSPLPAKPIRITGTDQLRSEFCTPAPRRRSFISTGGTSFPFRCLLANRCAVPQDIEDQLAPDRNHRSSLDDGGCCRLP